MTNVMKNAWEIARQGVEKFGGQVKEYFAEALRIAWDLFKKSNSKEMAEMELVKEVKFGKAVARITVSGTFQNETFHQFVKGGEVFISEKIEIVHNGKIVGEGNYAYSMEYNEIYDRTYEKHNLDTRKTYTQIKGKKSALFCEGKETAEEINALIKSMEEEIETHYKVKLSSKKKHQLWKTLKKSLNLPNSKALKS